jgi:hypothetical protein
MLCWRASQSTELVLATATAAAAAAAVFFVAVVGFYCDARVANARGASTKWRRRYWGSIDDRAFSSSFSSSCSDVDTSAMVTI